jgi:hypothetical protein
MLYKMLRGTIVQGKTFAKNEIVDLEGKDAKYLLEIGVVTPVSEGMKRDLEAVKSVPISIPVPKKKKKEDDGEFLKKVE